MGRLMGLVQRNAAEILTVSRSTTGTYYDAAGLLATAQPGELRFDHNPSTLVARGLLVEESRANLLTYSGDLTNANWTKTLATVTGSAAAAPDGTQTANLLIPTTTSGSHVVASKAIACSALTQYTVSVFVKASAYSQLRLRVADSAGLITAPVFDSATGAFISGTGSFEALPNGWYRIWVTVTTTSAATWLALQLWVYSGATATFAGDGASGVLVWGAQMELGADVSSLIPTTSASVTRAADAVGMVTAKTGSRTNLVAPSNDFTGWTASGGAVVTSAAQAGPNGKADTVSLPAGASIALDVAALVAGDYSLSVFAQAASGTPELALSGDAFTTTATAVFDLAEGEVTSTTDAAGLVPTLKGWVRLALLAAANAAGSGTLTISNPGTTTVTLGLWGAQLEASPVTTPLIQTTTAVATALDYFNWYNAVEGTLVGAFPSTWGATLLSLDDGTDGFRIRQDATGAVLFEILADGATMVTLTGAVVAADADLYVAACWRRTGNGMKVALAVNGVVSTSSLWLRFHYALPTTLWIGSSGGAAGFLNGCARRARFFKGAQFDTLASLASES